MTIGNKIKNWWNEQYSFKKYIICNLLFMIMTLSLLVKTPPEGDTLYETPYFENRWEFTNADVYFHAMLNLNIIFALVFLLAMSNKEKHPKLAKFLFLSPWIYFFCKALPYWFFNIRVDIF